MKFILHIGYPRTGTTWLQKRIFTKNKTINYIGCKSYNGKILKISKEKHLEFIKNINNLDINNYFEKEFFSKKKINVFSSENFTHFQYNSLNLHDNSLNLYLDKLIKYLKKNFKNVKIEVLCVYREPISFLRSIFFKKNIRARKLFKTDKYDIFLEKLINSKIKNNNYYRLSKTLQYDNLYFNLKKNFKDIKLTFIDFDIIKNNSPKYASILSDIFHIKKDLIKKELNYKENYLHKSKDENLIYYNTYLLHLIKKNFYYLKYITPRFIRKKFFFLFFKNYNLNNPKIVSMENIIKKKFFKHYINLNSIKK